MTDSLTQFGCTRRSRALIGVLVPALVLSLAFLGGCSSGTKAADTGDSSKPAAVKPAKLRIGTLSTEDSLPLWVAEQDGLFKKAGLEVEIIVFQSAQERDAALTARAIDAEMGDMIAAALLEAGGYPVSITTVMLGADNSQGRFGIVAGPKSPVKTLADLKSNAVGTSLGTIQEYVIDGLAKQAGLDPATLKKEEVKKVPVRFELLMSGKLPAAALPEPFLSLAEKQGARVLAVDTDPSAPNLSQTVLIASDAYLQTPEGSVAMRELLDVWDKAVTVVNSDPGAWRALLTEKARLPEPLKNSYVMSAYPKAQLPAQDRLDAVLEWMLSNKLLKDANLNLLWTADGTPQG